MNVGIYIRVSTEEQVKEGFSISAQKQKLEAYCMAQGWDSYKLYVDQGVSAKNTDRPELQRLLEDIKRQKIKTVLVYRLDRFTRSVLDLQNLLNDMEENECAFVSATELYDTTTAMGRMFINVVAAMAQWERENLGERIRMGLVEKARQGKYHAQTPFGFIKKDHKLYPHPERSEVLLDMIQKIEEGYSLQGLATYLNDSPHQPVRGYRWHGTSILSMLRNPVLYGGMMWQGELFEDVHEGLISKERFLHLGKLLTSRQNHKKRKVNSFFTYQMKLVCPQCSTHLTSERNTYERKDGSLLEHNRYTCQKCSRDKRKAVSFSETKFEEAFMNYIETLHVHGVPPEMKEKDPREEIDKKIKQLENQRAKYQKGWANDWISDEEFKTRMEETQYAINEWEEERSQLKAKVETASPEQIEIYAKSIIDNYKKLTPREKHEFLNIAVKDIYFDFKEEWYTGAKGKRQKRRHLWVTKVEFM
ncbi:recombinase family protein [Salimicrobium album]|uniref:Site-specific DNA recombinase n=1 Tax=Salimicrobium album TaxID=50717 RepID=A0A1H3DC56_9BACI|nr:recombinase family protein [Salimicrobium album]SDX63995.1 Site-specific DNA recombinase [Salimicrobium album]